MAVTPYPGDGIAAQLAWIRDEIGPAGTWLVAVNRRSSDRLRWHRHRSVTTDLIATLADENADVDDEACPDGSLEASGLAVGLATSIYDDAPFLELDHISLTLTDPTDRTRATTVRLYADRLPALWVDTLAELVDRRDWSEFDQQLIGNLIQGCSGARHSEMGLTRQHSRVGEHRRWARVGHSLLADLAHTVPTYSSDEQARITQRAREIAAEQQLNGALGLFRAAN